MGIGDFVDIPGDEIGRGDRAPETVAEDSDWTYIACHITHSMHCLAGFE